MTPAGWTRRWPPSKWGSRARRDRPSRGTTPPPRSFQLGRYAEARQRYLEARQRADGSLRTKIDYALGNTALALGDIPGAIRSYDDCLASTAGGAALDAVRRDAAINRRFALEQAQSLAVPQDAELRRPAAVPAAGPAERPKPPWQR